MKKILSRIGIGILSLLAILMVVFFIWASSIYTADQGKLNLVLDEAASNLSITEKEEYWEILPNGSGTLLSTDKDTGFIFYPGGKVDPKAYFYKLADLSNGQARTMKVFVTKPAFNLAFFSIDQADAVIAEHPEIKKWIIGGHSLGGSMSCEYAKSNTGKVSELWMFAAYCGSDISNTQIKVVSIHGSLDGILTPQKLAENKKNLPSSAQDIEIEGMNHAQFGDYGVQSGDNIATKDDETVRENLIQILKQL